jgi:hypothetical protein
MTGTWQLSVPALGVPAGAMGASIPPPTPPSRATMTGTVSYREHIALPPGATVMVRLQGVSRADAPAEVLAEQVLTQSRPTHVEVWSGVSLGADLLLGGLETAMPGDDLIADRLVRGLGDDAAPHEVELRTVRPPLHDILGVRRTDAREGGEHFLRGGIDIDQAVGAFGVEVGIAGKVEILLPLVDRRGPDLGAEQQGDEGEQQDESEQTACGHQGLGVNRNFGGYTPEGGERMHGRGKSQ